MVGGLKLEDLSWGMCNNLTDSNQSQLTGDPRRTSPLGAVQRATELAFLKDAIGSRTEYDGFVVDFKAENFATFQNKAQMFQAYTYLQPGGPPSQQYENVVYKVYLPELMPAPPPKSTDDGEQVQKLLISYPAIYSALDFKEAIPKGSFVTVRFEDPANVQGGKIVKIIERAVGIVGLSTDASGNPLENVFFDGTPRLLGPGAFENLAGQDQTDHKGNLVPGDAAGCSDSRTGQRIPQGILDEPIVRSTIVPQYGGDPSRKVGFIKGKESFIQKVEAAYQSLQTQGIDLIVGDTYRSYSTQKSAYMEKGQPGQEKAGDIAHPCRGYHTQGQAIDIAQGAAQKADLLAHGPIYQALYAAGLRRIGNEFWHWSVGETTHDRDKIFAANRSGTSPADTFPATA